LALGLRFVSVVLRDGRGAAVLCRYRDGTAASDAAKFPKIVFKSERVVMTGAKSMQISGTLTLHGVTRPMLLTATFNGGYPGMPNMDPHARIGFSAHGSLKRSDFGMVFGVPALGTTMGVGDEIELAIEAEFSGPALASPAGEAHSHLFEPDLSDERIPVQAIPRHTIFRLSWDDAKSMAFSLHRDYPLELSHGAGAAGRPFPFCRGAASALADLQRGPDVSLCIQTS
jgi:hypothetical protein